MRSTVFMLRRYALPLCAAVAATIVVFLIVAMTRPLDLARASAQSAQPGCQTFSQTGKTVCGKFLAYWNTHGGLAQQGYPISGEFTEVSDLDGKPYTVQYFERAVFEAHPENQPPYDVLLSQLGTFRYKQKYPNAEPTPAPALPPGLNVPVTLRQGVTITLVPSHGSYGTGIQSGCFGSMYWVFQLDNASSAPYTVIVDQRSLSMADDLGKHYDLESRCGGTPYAADFPGPTTLGAGQSTYGVVLFNPKDLPADAHYLDLHISLSGTNLAFRFPLH